MAKVLKEFEFSQGRKSRHDWSKFMDGRIWQLKRGEDFACQASSFRTQLHHVALRAQMTVSTEVDGDNVTFQFSKNGSA